jgi:hypothetical protein
MQLGAGGAEPEARRVMRGGMRGRAHGGQIWRCSQSVNSDWNWRSETLFSIHGQGGGAERGAGGRVAAAEGGVQAPGLHGLQARRPLQAPARVHCSQRNACCPRCAPDPPSSPAAAAACALALQPTCGLRPGWAAPAGAHPAAAGSRQQVKSAAAGAAGRGASQRWPPAARQAGGSCSLGWAPRAAGPAAAAPCRDSPRGGRERRRLCPLLSSDGGYTLTHACSPARLPAAGEVLHHTLPKTL